MVTVAFILPSPIKPNSFELVLQLSGVVIRLLPPSFLVPFEPAHTAASSAHLPLLAAELEASATVPFLSLGPRVLPH